MQETYTDILEARIAELEAENADLQRDVAACDELLDRMVPALAKIKKLAKKAIEVRGPRLKIAG
jgi:hypothetical protein